VLAPAAWLLVPATASVGPELESSPQAWVKIADPTTANQARCHLMTGSMSGRAGSITEIVRGGALAVAAVIFQFRARLAAKNFGRSAPGGG